MAARRQPTRQRRLAESGVVKAVNKGFAWAFRDQSGPSQTAGTMSVSEEASRGHWRPGVRNRLPILCPVVLCPRRVQHGTDTRRDRSSGEAAPLRNRGGSIVSRGDRPDARADRQQVEHGGKEGQVTGLEPGELYAVGPVGVVVHATEGSSPLRPRRRPHIANPLREEIDDRHEVGVFALVR